MFFLFAKLLGLHIGRHSFDAGSKGNAVAKVTASFSEGVAYESLIVQFPDGEVVDLDV